MASFPTALPSFAGFTSSHTLAADSHAAQHNSEQAEVVAIATKIGTGVSTPVANTFLGGTGIGTSGYRQVTLTSDVTGILPIANGGTAASSAAAARTSLSLYSTTEVDAAILAAKQALYPVGCIYTEMTGTNPSSTFGFGTWVAFGGGRVLVGNGTSDQVFAAGASGGESTHTLITAETPSHTHTTTLAANSTVGGTGNYFAGNNSGALAAPSSSVGSDGAHNNLQPYTVVYFWRRTV